LSKTQALKRSTPLKPKQSKNVPAREKATASTSIATNPESSRASKRLKTQETAKSRELSKIPELTEVSKGSEIPKGPKIPKIPKGPKLSRLKEGVVREKSAAPGIEQVQAVRGKVQGHREGHGFVHPDDGTPSLFLPPEEMQRAMHGDLVLAQARGADNRGRRTASILQILEHARPRLVGRLVQERGLSWVVPEDARIKHDILVAPADLAGAFAGQVVVVDILNPPSGLGQASGRVVEVLGAIDDPGMEIEIAVRKFEVPAIFNARTLKEVEKLPDRLRPVDLRWRVDLRDLAFVTIDGEDARDFDDAVYCERSAEEGAFRLLVAIADVAHYVKSGTGLDQDAQLRGTSVYFPRRVIPMLPEKLSNDLCSLKPQVDRLTLVCDMVVSTTGEVQAYQFYEAVIRSAARCTYDEVWRILSRTDPLALRKHQPVLEALERLQQVHLALAHARAVRGAIEFETVETRMVMDDLGRIKRIEARQRNDAHRLIEECMLAANLSAADFLIRSQHPGLFRVHEGPSLERLLRLRTYLSQLGLELGGGDKPQPSDYARLSDRIRHRPERLHIQSMMLRSMQQAVYTPHNQGHFGLAYEAYTHFTSPIRRYPDLLVHRVIKALVHSKRFALVRSGDILVQWEQLGLRCSAAERRADEASRDVEAWLKCQFMKERVGDVYPGKVSGVVPFGLFITLDELYVEGLLHISELGNEYFQFTEASQELRGERTGRRYRIGHEMLVQVSRVDLEARRIEFGMRDLARRGARRAALEHAGPEAVKSTDTSPPKKRGEAKTTRARPPRKARNGASRG